MVVLCPKAGSLAFTPPGDEMSEVVSRCLPHRQLWVRNLTKVATQWHEVDSNLWSYGCKVQNMPLHLHEKIINSLISATAKELKVTIPRWRSVLTCTFNIISMVEMVSESTKNNLEEIW